MFLPSFFFYSFCRQCENITDLNAFKCLCSKSCDIRTVFVFKWWEMSVLNCIGLKINFRHKMVRDADYVISLLRWWLFGSCDMRDKKQKKDLMGCRISNKHLLWKTIYFYSLKRNQLWFSRFSVRSPVVHPKNGTCIVTVLNCIFFPPQTVFQKCKPFSDIRWTTVYMHMSFKHLQIDYFHKLNNLEQITLWRYRNLDHFCSASPIKCIHADNANVA